MRHWPVSRVFRSAVLLWAAMGWLSCTGTIGTGTSSRGESGDEPEDGAAGGAGGRDIGPPPSAPDLSWPVSYDGTPSNLRRLSREEIIGTLRSVIGVAPPREALPLERRPAAHALLTTAGASLIASEVDTLALALTDLAKEAAPQTLAKSKCGSSGDSQKQCLTRYTESLASRAFRRPLTGDEVMRLGKLFAAAGASPADDLAAVEAMIFTVFFSPSFLYRKEVGGDTLSGEQIAERMAFLVTQAPPDPELLAAGKSGELLDPDERVKHFDRLSGTAAAIGALTSFVLEHLGATDSQIEKKSSAYLTGLPDGYPADARASAIATISQALREGPGTLAELLTTTAYLKHPPLSPIFAENDNGRSTTGDGADTGRKGLLMHPYVLSALTKESGSSPFPIGMFIRENILCEQIPPPPPGAVEMVKREVPVGLSEREDYEYRTNAAAACTACHATFSPMGYAFLPFDPVGRWAKEDATGQPWDLAGEVPLHSGDLGFASPSELTRNLAELKQTHGCFAQAALMWAFGRRPVQRDEALLSKLAALSEETQGEVKALFRAIVTSDEFVQTATSSR